MVADSGSVSDLDFLLAKCLAVGASGASRAAILRCVHQMRSWSWMEDGSPVCDYELLDLYNQNVGDDAPIDGSGLMVGISRRITLIIEDYLFYRNIIKYRGVRTFLESNRSVRRDYAAALGRS